MAIAATTVNPANPLEPTQAELELLSKMVRSTLLSRPERRMLRQIQDRYACLLGRRQAPSSSCGVSLAVGRVHLLLPAYNEEESLPRLLDRLSQLEFSDCFVAWVVDDGSTDRTADITRRGVPGLDCRLVSHPTNVGLGQAVLSGIQACLREASPQDVLVVMDADDTHGTELLAGMRQWISDGADIVLASRFVDGGDDRTAPPFRRLLSRGASLLFRICLPLDGIRDFTSGYRAYRIDLLQRALQHWGERLVEERGFACMVELLLKLRFFRPQIQEVPLVLRYDRKQGSSKLKLLPTLLQYLKLGLRNMLQPPPVRIG